MKTVTIGFVREDGDIQVLATLNNNDEHIHEAAFNVIIERVRRDLQMYCDTHRIEIFERQDAPDYVTPEGEMKC